MPDPSDQPARRNPLADLFRVDGRVALITGAGGGIGQMAARTLAEAGALVIVTDRDGDAAASAARAIKADGFEAQAFAMDVTDEGQVAHVFEHVAKTHAAVGILVNNAGIIDKAPTTELSLAQWQRVVDVNLTGVFLCAREAGRQMLPRRSGSVINISSIWGHVGGPFSGNASYHATKGAVVNLTRALAVEWGPFGVRVNDIAPTFLETTLTQALFADAETHAALVAQTPLGRLGTPQDLRGAILFLASDASGLTTGLSLRVDGGWVAR